MKSHATYAGDPRHHATDLAELRAEVERLRAIDVQQIAAGVLVEYLTCQEDVFHAATRIAERVDL